MQKELKLDYFGYEPIKLIYRNLKQTMDLKCIRRCYDRQQVFET